MYVKSQINFEFLENYSITPEAKKKAIQQKIITITITFKKLPHYVGGYIMLSERKRTLRDRMMSFFRHQPYCLIQYSSLPLWQSLSEQTNTLYITCKLVWGVMMKKRKEKRTCSQISVSHSVTSRSGCPPSHVSTVCVAVQSNWTVQNTVSSVCSWKAFEHSCLCWFCKQVFALVFASAVW